MSVSWNQENNNSDYSRRVAWEQFRYGYDLFIAKEPVTNCQNIQQRRGWWAALEAASVASLPANCADRLGF